MQRVALQEWADAGKVERIPSWPNRAVCLARVLAVCGNSGRRYDKNTKPSPPARRWLRPALTCICNVLPYHRKPCAFGGYAPRERIFPEPYRYAGGQLFLKVTPLITGTLPLPGAAPTSTAGVWPPSHCPITP